VDVLAKFVQAGKRPVSGKETAVVSTFLTSCWHDKPTERKKFADFAEYREEGGKKKVKPKGLDQEPWSLILSASTARGLVPAQEFWNECTTQSKIEQAAYWSVIRTVYAEKFSDNSLRDSVEARCALSAFLNVDEETEKPIVTAANWTVYVDWFLLSGDSGPRNKLTILVDILKQDWFWGNQSETDADNVLAFSEPGTFLVRLSQTTKGVFTLSWVEIKDDSPVIKHERITQYAEVLVKLVNKLVETKKKKDSKTKTLRIPAPGRPDKYASFVAKAAQEKEQSKDKKKK